MKAKLYNAFFTLLRERVVALWYAEERALEALYAPLAEGIMEPIFESALRRKCLIGQLAAINDRRLDAHKNFRSFMRDPIDYASRNPADLLDAQAALSQPITPHYIVENDARFREIREAQGEQNGG